MNAPTLPAGLEGLARNTGWLLLLGIALVALGTVALGYSLAATVFAVVFLGWMLLLSGVVHAVDVFRSSGAHGSFPHLLGAVLDLVLGTLLLVNPEAGALSLTLLFAAFLLVGGAFRAVAAVSLRLPGWGWAAGSGVIAMVLGTLLLRQWPASGLWFIGLCVAVDLIFRGWSCVMLSLGLRGLAARTA